MGRHLVLGAGAVGRATAAALLAEGEDVVVASRSGSGVGDDRAEPVVVDATDAVALSRLASGTRAIYNCANPKYHRWAKDWPPIADALLAAAEQSGAVLVTMSNLYAYGEVDHPMTPSDPLAATFTNGQVRAQMWQDAKAAHDAGRLRATEARASDFFGPGAGGTSHLGRALPRLLAGRPVRVLGDPDVAHSWTFIPDVGRTLATLGREESAWGRAWHVPSNPPLSQRQLLEAAAAVAGVEVPRIGRLPESLLAALSLLWPTMRSLRQVGYQFDSAFVIDASATEAAFALTATPLDEALADTLRAEQVAPRLPVARS
jgi:nucleoside-diphosphate-sugar epimerase